MSSTQRLLVVRSLVGIGIVLVLLVIEMGLVPNFPNIPEQIYIVRGVAGAFLGVIVPLCLWATAAYIAFGTTRRATDVASRRPPNGNDQVAKLATIIRTIGELHAEALKGKSDEEAKAFLQSILDQYDIVYGVWDDPRGSGATAIKGYGLVRDALHSGDIGTLRISAVPCTREQGIAAMQRTSRMKY
jgi:hypothetical protein